MRVPWPVLVANVMVLAPPVAAAARWRLVRGARAWVLVWALLYVLEDAFAIPMAMAGRNNHILDYIFVPLHGAAILWAMSLWQLNQFARLTIRAVIPAFLVAWLLLLVVEDTSNFSRVAEPVYSLLALGATLYTLLSRGAETTEPLLRTDWFWICVGLTLHFGALALLTPLGAALVKDNPEVVARAYVVRAWLNMLAYALISIGLLCPLPSAPSGPSFSPASSA